MSEDTLVTVNLTNDELLALCLMAHKENITLNDLVNRILMERASDINHSKKETFEDHYDDTKELLKSYRNYFYSPSHFTDLCHNLYDMLSDEDKVIVDSITETKFEKYLAGVHFTYGKWLRNELCLWDTNTSIVEWFNHMYELNHADDISSLIIAGLVFRNQPIIRERVIAKLVDEFHDHWNKV